MFEQQPPQPPDAEGDGSGVAVDPITALGTTLSRLDGRVATLADRAGQGPLLVAVVERDDPLCRTALQALATTGARCSVVSQGRPEAAMLLRDACGLEEQDLLIEPAPHPVSDALAARTVPTFVLIEGLELTAWQDGWDPAIMTRLVARAGGQLSDPTELDSGRPRPSRLAHDAGEVARREAEDAALADPH